MLPHRPASLVRAHRWLALHVALAILVSGCAAASALVPAQSGGRALTFRELMQFRQIEDATLSDDGSWIAYSLVPDRGDGEAVFHSVEGDSEVRVVRGHAPQISADGRWGVALVQPAFEERETARKEKKEGNEAPKPGLSIVALETGAEERLEEVESFALSEDGQWLAYRHHRPEDEDPGDEEAERDEPQVTAEPGEPEDEDEDLEDPDLGSTLHLRQLATGRTTSRENVLHFAFDDTSASFVFAVSALEGVGNGLFAFDLTADELQAASLHAADLAVYSHLTWAHERNRLAFLSATFDRAEGEAGDAELWTWDGSGVPRRVAASTDAPQGFRLPAVNQLTFSRDGERLFFGFAETNGDEPEDEDQGEDEPFDPYDLDAILAERGVDVWHWNDPWISTNQKKRWEEDEKDRVYLSVAHLSDGRIVQLADRALPDIRPSDNALVAIGSSDVPYRKEVTWDGVYVDLQLVDLDTGERQLVGKRIASRSARGARLSPSGRFLSYYEDGDWHLFDRTVGASRNVTAKSTVPFANEDHDYPSDPPGYGTSEWLADDSAILLYDKYDIWRAPTDGGAPTRLTSGRAEEIVHRVVDQDPETDVIAPGSQLLLRTYHDREKHDAFVSLALDQGAERSLYATGEHKLGFVERAKDAALTLFTRERYDEFPDLWVTDFQSEPARLSDANPQRGEFAWGSAELVDWTSLDGTPLQGVLIKPGNYEEGRRYPVLVYFYRFFSQRLHEFNAPVVNHRPSFPMYASNGYAVFLPDIRFDIGQPGFSATKCLVPGIQKLIDMGVADPDAVGLHGHSWSGYQAAFVITQTDIFKAAVAGAPVSNMTSAYSGIRWGTGLARQFQYEKSQSRIGGSLWETPERYIENSPVFFADRIETPLLIEFGDEDEAVPWYQGIELYLACRRLGKECIFLQYRGEPHHLKQYGNKLDYSIKMMEFFDHHLKGVAAPEWMTEGVPYRGE